jgi:hypothetical protein
MNKEINQLHFGLYRFCIIEEIVEYNLRVELKWLQSLVSLYIYERLRTTRRTQEQ